MDRDKSDFARLESEKAETYQGIIKQIQQSRGKIREMQSKQQTLSRQLITKAKEIGDLEIDKRGKERLIKSN